MHGKEKEKIEEAIALIRSVLENRGYQVQIIRPWPNNPIYAITVYKDGFTLGVLRLINRSKLIVKIVSITLSTNKEVSLYDPESIDRIIGMLDPIQPL